MAAVCAHLLDPPTPAHANGAAKITVVRCRAVRGRYRIEPGRAQGEHRTLPALRNVAQVGLPGLQAQGLGGRAAVRMRVSPGAARTGGQALRGRPKRLSKLRSAAGDWSICFACRHLHRIWRPRGTESPRFARGRRISLAFSSGTRRRERPAGWYPRGRDRGMGQTRSPGIDRAPGCPVEVARGLSQAESLAARARQVERTDPSVARDLYRQSLAIAADLPDALTGLKRTPPDPPTALDGQVHGDRIRLWWTPPAPDGLGSLTFVVVRKGGGPLVHPGDGTRIAEVSTCEFDDTHATPGESVGYAVLEQARGVESVTAISLGPFVYLADVKDVRVELHHREVELAWTLPRGVSDVRVIRKQGGPPKNPRDGERIPAALDHALDRNVDPDEVYHYGIYAIYPMADGRLVPSPGVVVSARPQPPVSALEAPRLLLEPGRRIRIDWIEPVRGSVKIVRTCQPLTQAVGSQLAIAETESLGGHWIEPAGPDRAYDLEPPLEGHCYYTPLTFWAGTYTVGHAAALSRVADPTELRATRTGTGLGATSAETRVTLRWRWSNEASACLVVARQGGPPIGPSDPDAFQAIVHRTDYDRQECCTLSLVSPHASGNNGRRPTRDAPSR